MLVAGFMLCLAFLLYFAASPEHIAACQPAARVAEASEGPGFWSNAFVLVLGRRFRSFQVFLLTLGMCTANMYLIPTFGAMLPHWDEELDASWAAALVSFTFLGNLAARVSALLLSQYVGSVTFVRLGCGLLVLGSVLGVALDFLAIPSWVAFLASGLVVQAGWGLVAPNCKAGALLGVPKEISSAANSLLKMSQLLFTAVAQLLGTSVASFTDFFILLLAWNGLCLSVVVLGVCTAEMEGAKAPPFEASQGSSQKFSERRQGFNATLTVDQILVNVQRCRDVAAPSKQQDQFVRIYNTYGFCLLDCSEEADLRELKAIFGTIVPHELANDEGCVVLDPHAKRTSSNVRNSEAEHKVHTDETYSNKPGAVITLQCDIAAEDGGESVLISGKQMHDAAVSSLRPEQMQELYSPCLCVGRTLPGSDNWEECTFPIFRKVGSHSQVRYRSKDTYVKQVAGDSAGYSFCEDFVETEANRFILALKPGQVLILDNRAILHGRLPFPAGQRRRMLRINYFGDGALTDRLIMGFPEGEEV